MLEQPSLLLRPWIHSFEMAWPKTQVQGSGWVRAIVNPTTDRDLGFAAWGSSGISWLAWLGRKRIQVFEGEDASLLLGLYRTWGLVRLWDVFDSEERRVAHVERDAICDGLGTRLATMCAAMDDSESVLRGEDGVLLATWQQIPGQGCYFRFGEVANSPFIRMAALAGVLALPPWPGDVSLAARPAV
jgi:hypothetical protein